MNNVSVNSIEKVCQPIGGLKSAMFIVSEHPDVIIPAINTSQAAEDIEFNGSEAEAIFYVNFRTSSAIFEEEKLTDNPAGDYYVYNLEGWIQKRRKAAVDLVHALENRTVHCVVTDRNDETTLILNLRHGSKYSSGDRIGSPNGYTFQFRVVTPRIAPKYGFTLPDPGDGGGDPGGGGEEPPTAEVQEIAVHREFVETGNTITPIEFGETYLVFRDNIHLIKDDATKGYTETPGVGITLTEDIRIDNPRGGEWITILYLKETP